MYEVSIVSSDAKEGAYLLRLRSGHFLNGSDLLCLWSDPSPSNMVSEVGHFLCPKFTLPQFQGQAFGLESFEHSSYMLHMV